MRKGLLELVRCPACRGEKFNLCVQDENHIEIRQGRITCLGCGSTFEINQGILDLLVAPTPEIISERDGWTILEKAVVNTDEVMLALPDGIGEHKQAWQSQAVNFHFMWSQLQLTGTERVLDLGAGRCWSTRFFARQGCHAVGLDILLTKYVGLLTADVYIDHEGIYFDRVCGNMNDLPFRNATFDLVFATATMHHSSDLSVTTREVARVLKPGGRAITINEPVVGLFQSKHLDCPEIQCGINEHVYRMLEYLGAWRGADMVCQVYPFAGSYHPFIAGINHVLMRMFPQLLSQSVWWPLVCAQLLIFGGPLNLFAFKPSR